MRQLQTLVAIADRGSFQAAAESLGLTQSAVSMQIKALEDELQAPLFDRTKRPPAITPLGRSVLDRAREVVRLYETLRDTAARDLAGNLRLGVIPTVATGILPDALVDLKTLHPRLQITITSGLSDDLARSVAAGDLDAAVITGPSPREASLAVRTVVEEALIIVAHRDLADDTAAELLSQRPFVRFNRRTGVGRLIDEGLRDRGLRVTTAMELDSLEAILLMVTRGLGVAIVPETCLGTPAARQLRIIPLGDPPLKRSIDLVYPTKTTRPTLIAALYDRLARVAVG